VGHTRKGIVVLVLLSLLAFGSVAPVLGQIVVQDGIVNVSIGNITILREVDLALAANVVANVCNLEVAVVVLAASDVDAGGGPFMCTQRGSGRPVAITNN